MLVWATEFPVAAGSGCEDVFSVATRALATSQHTPWHTDDFSDDPTEELTRIEKDGHAVTTGLVGTDSGRIAGLQHQWVEHFEREWLLEIVGHQSNNNTLASVRLHCNGLRPGLRLPTPKKPYAVRKLLEDVGGGNDSGLEVQDQPHRLDEWAVDEAARLVNGTSQVRLPVVYVSAFGGHRPPIVDVRRLAQWLDGMAHVVVEPSRHFSFALARNTGRANAYGGAISVYWPHGAAAQVRYLPRSFSDSEEMERAVESRVREALIQIGPRSPCTFQHLQELSSRAQIARLRAEGSTEVEMYASAFDSEIKAKSEQIDDLQREVVRLRAEVSRYEQLAGSPVSTMVMPSGEEREFYAGEFSAP